MDPTPFEHDLTDCNSLSIQPDGVLLGLDDAGTIAQVAGDTRRLLGVEPEPLLGRPATELAGSTMAPWIELARHRAVGSAGYLGDWNPPAPGGGAWDVLGHRAGGRTILEFEPAPPVRPSAAAGLAELGRALATLHAADDLAALCAAAVTAVRRLTGFDRVLICRAGGDAEASVLAEESNGRLPELGSDRPHPCKRAHPVHAPCPDRAIFVADAARQPARLLGTPAPEAATDDAHRHLPGACAAQRRQLREMDVAAAMTLPLVIEGRVWGTLEGHHHTAHHLPYELRESCAHVGRALSRAIANRQDIVHRRESERLRERRTALLAELRHALDTRGRIHLDPQALVACVPSEGAALVSGGRARLAGQTPGERRVLELAGLLGPEPERGACATGRLDERSGSALAHAAPARGVLAATTGGADPLVLLWFRDEASGAGEAAASARTHGRSGGWTRAEVDAAAQLAGALGELARQQAVRELEGRLRDALAGQQTLIAEKDLLMQEVHHRVQNGLQIVNAMLQLQARQTTDPQVRAQFDGAVTRLLAIGAVHRHLWQSSEAEHVQLGRYLRQLCDDLMRSWGEEWSGHLTVDALDVALPSHTAVTLALVVTELLTNAVKYAYGGAPGPIAVRVNATGAHLEVAVIDHGRGLPKAGSGEGLGSRLIRVFTAQLDGEIEAVSSEGGTTMTVRMPLPAGHDFPGTHAPPTTGSSRGGDAAHAA